MSSSETPTYRPNKEKDCSWIESMEIMDAEDVPCFRRWVSRRWANDSEEAPERVSNAGGVGVSLLRLTIRVWDSLYWIQSRSGHVRSSFVSLV